MIGFYQQDNAWWSDGVSLAQAAQKYQTPLYFYSQSAFLGAYQSFLDRFSHSLPKICYAVKANDNLSLLALLVEKRAGFDIVSEGELVKVLQAGGRASDIVFSGVGKSLSDINAALTAGVGCFNIESQSELERLRDCCHRRKKQASVLIRLTLNIEVDTHRYLTTGLTCTKFGVPAQEGQQMAKYVSDSEELNFLGFSCHCGSQIQDEKVYLRQAEEMARQVNKAESENIHVSRVDLGGGFGIDEQQIEQSLPSFKNYDQLLNKLFAGKELILEPGRCIVSSAGVLLTTVEYIKTVGEKTFWIVDAGMNDLLRPALYNAVHPVASLNQSSSPLMQGDVAGPVCESADVLISDCQLNARAGEVLAIFNAGAYGAVMASNYNARLRPAAVLANEKKLSLIRRRETMEDLLKLEYMDKEE